jgi:hypothetical protein
MLTIVDIVAITVDNHLRFRRPLVVALQHCLNVIGRARIVRLCSLIHSSGTLPTKCTCLAASRRTTRSPVKEPPQIPHSPRDRGSVPGTHQVGVASQKNPAPRWALRRL